MKHVLDGVTLGHFACKRVPIGDDHAWLEKVLMEVQLLQTLSHQNLVSYRHVWLEDFQLNTFGPSVPCAFILQQYCNGGDMHNYVCGSAQATTTTQELKERIRRRSKGESEMPRKLNEPKKLQFEEIYSFFRDIAAGLRFLHLNGFIHRDLKPSNCLLHTTNHETRVLVSDFGEVQYEDATRRSTGATGTISYCAPEVLQRLSPGGPFANFTLKSDIFSLGMILYFLCFADLPYRAADVLHEEREDIDVLRAEILSWEGFDDHRKLRPDLPAKLYAFLKRLLSLNPDERPSADEVYSGIIKGGLDEAPDLRRRSSAAPEELTPGRRIQKLDTPVQGNSPRRGSVRAPDNKSLSDLRRRPHSRGRGPLGLGIDGAVKAEHENDDDDIAVTEPTPLNNSIVLRPKSASPIPAQPSQPPDAHHSPPLLRPQLLIEPPRSRWSALSTHVHNVLHVRIESRNTRIFVLVLKLLCILQPCVETGLNPTVVYPLISLAVVESTLTPWLMWQAGVATALHGAALAWAWRTGSLCSAGGGLVELWEGE